jgi:iron complex transport system permease protein
MTTRVTWALLLSLALAAALASLLLGSGDVTAGEALSVLEKWARGGDLTERDQFVAMVVLSLRLPRMLLAAFVGGALASAGVLTQGLFRNALADPTILGATSGASLAAALVFYTLGTGLVWWLLPAAAFGGALFALVLLVAIMGRRGGWALEHMLLGGFALNAVLAALTSLVISLSLEDARRAPAMMHWMMGSLAYKEPRQVLFALIPCLGGLTMGLALTRRLDVMTLGEDVARVLSVDLARLKMATIVAVALLIGSAVSVAGAIPFVGLVVPHITRLLVSPRHRPLFWASVVNGVTLVLVADLFARTAIAPREMQVGVLIALLGAPFFLALLSRRQHTGWGHI